MCGKSDFNFQLTSLISSRAPEGHMGLHQSKIQTEEEELQELWVGYSQWSQGTSLTVYVCV